ncbi:hypothetical protein ATANTOWER_011575 [Ataeniobius toweri]|uniref:Uncharacterized protein n=1 Tax=Ataeniobius toweri TaxID=208326 RepID=A0ABU7BGR7_9TELE|nr:hypothetical protein [Ataeniobius toweri]
MKHVCPLTRHHFSHLHLEEGTRKSFPLNATHHHLPISVSLLAFLLWNSTISPAVCSGVGVESETELKKRANHR